VSVAAVLMVMKRLSLRGRCTSLQTSMLPKTTWSPSKKLSPTIMTVVPPVVQPSLGQIALIVGVAAAHKNPATADHPRSPLKIAVHQVRSINHFTVTVTTYAGDTGASCSKTTGKARHRHTTRNVDSRNGTTFEVSHKHKHKRVQNEPLNKHRCLNLQVKSWTYVCGSGYILFTVCPNFSHQFFGCVLKAVVEPHGVSFNLVRVWWQVGKETSVVKL